MAVPTRFELVQAMHEKFSVNEVASKLTLEKLIEFVHFRVDTMAREEVNETVQAIEDKDALEIFDGLLDTLVFTYGTLDILGFTEHQVNEGFRRVMEANLAKEPGVKKERPNPFGFPDLIKPEGWTPCNLDNLVQRLKEKLNPVESQKGPF